jgi:hypothetical protein
MNNSNIPSGADLPSTERLIKSTVVAVLVAILLLLVAILPAEYGIDPTGIGKILGLRKMGEIKVSLAQEVVAAHTGEPIALNLQIVPPSEPIAAPSLPVSEKSEATVLSHEMKVSLVPNEGTEIKVVMEKGGKVDYTWWTDGGRANFDVHGDSKKLNINYHNYSKGSEEKREGVIEAAFDGSHGWFWRNRTSKAMTITLKTSGEYTDIKHLK